MRRLVLARGIPFEAVPDVAEQLGWSAAGVPAHERGDVKADYLRDGLRVRWVDDSLSQWSYVLVPESSAEDWQAALHDRSALVSREAAIRRFGAARGIAESCDALLVLGLFAHGPFDDEIFAALAAGLLSASEQVRGAALTALTYAGWSEFEPMLREAFRQVPASSQLKREAQEIADRMRESQWNRNYYLSDP